MRKIGIRGLLLMGFMLPLPAMAVLGGDEATVQNERIQMKAALQVTRTSTYSVHEMTMPTGVTIRQYVSPQGKVFGIAWQGPVAPDLRQLLGNYFEQVSQAVQERRGQGRVVRGPVSIQQPGVVFQQTGHMRSYFGRAYVPELLPQGVGAESVR